MFETLTRLPDDALLALIGQFRNDPRPEKVDLGVGVFRDQEGETPVLKAVKAAERTLLDRQKTKAYVGPAGDQAFIDHVWMLIAGRVIDPDRVVGVQTVGGSGALRLACDLIRASGRDTVWMGVPTWPNHPGIFAAAGLQVAEYPYFDVPSQQVLFDRLIEALGRASAGDVALLHASCHNPTGGPLSDEQWDAAARLMAKRGVVPLIDLAYQGFGRGVEEDVAGLRRLLAHVPEALVAVSCSKSFGLYRERTGAIFAVASTPDAAAAVRSHILGTARVMYSMPPDHGAAIVRTILGDADLRGQWEAELEAMRGRIQSLRIILASELGRTHPVLRAIAAQEGMFSLLPLRKEQVLHLKEEHGIYMPLSGRINIAGLKAEQVAGVVEAVVSA